MTLRRKKDDRRDLEAFLAEDGAERPDGLSIILLALSLGLALTSILLGH